MTSAATIILRETTFDGMFLTKYPLLVKPLFLLSQSQAAVTSSLWDFCSFSIISSVGSPVNGFFKFLSLREFRDLFSFLFLLSIISLDFTEYRSLKRNLNRKAVYILMKTRLMISLFSRTCFRIMKVIQRVFRESLRYQKVKIRVKR